MSTAPPADSLGPYLRLSHRLSLAPFAYPIIGVAFVAFRFYLLLRSSSSLVQDAKDFVISTCLSAQRTASTAVSLPRWMAIETNQNLIRVATNLLDGAREGLILCLTAVEKIIIFVIGTFAGFYGCIFEFLIKGSLATIITITQFVENGLNALGGDITSAVSSAQNGINSIVNGINSLLSDVGLGSHDIPNMNVPVDSLNLRVPDTVSSTLTSLSNSLPTLDQLVQDLENLISSPFSSLESKINTTFLELETTTLHADGLPIPDARTLDFCSEIDLGVIDSVGNKLIWIIRWMAIALAILVFLMIIISLIIEWYRWISLQAAIHSISDSWVDPTAPEGEAAVPVVELTRNNILILQSQLQHGFRTMFLAKIRHLFHFRRQTTSSMSWFITYITYPSALMFLIIGLLGLIVIAIQYSFLGPLQKELQNLEDLIIGNYTEKIFNSITTAIDEDISTYATDVNGWIDTTQSGINDDVFGFATTAADAVNGTVVRLYGDMESGIQSALSGTVFADAVIEFLRCLIGNKVFELEAGLAWLKAHMHISLPHVDPTFLQIKASSISEMSNSINAAASTQDTSGSDVSGISGHIITAYKDILKGEAILFSVFLGVWGLVVLEACGILIWHRVKHAWSTRRAATETPVADTSDMREKVTNNV